MIGEEYGKRESTISGNRGLALHLAPEREMVLPHGAGSLPIPDASATVSFRPAASRPLS